MNQRRKIQKPPVPPQRVLVVDDDPIIRDMMVDLLEAEGYQPVLAHNGQQALDILMGPDNYLVFLDLLMPVLSGKDLCKILNNQPDLRSRHVIVLMSALDNMDETYNLDVDMVMSKPFMIDQLVEVLETYMA